MHVMAWLTYEVWVFYVNILGIMFFLFIASFVQFKSIRDRLGYAGNMRTRMDFLRYCENDIHWWYIWFCQVALYCAGLAFRTNTKNSLGLSASQALVILIAGLILNMTLYFNKRFEITKLD